MSKIYSLRGMLLALLFIIPSTFVGLAEADDAIIGQSSGQVFPDDTAPNTVRWELRTASDQAVTWEYTFPTINSFQDWSLFKSATAATAASLNIDWAAWSAAVTNPAYTRWLVTRNGVTIEKPWPGVSVGITPSFTLNELDLSIGKTMTSGHGNVGVGTGALDRAIVPEPSAILLLVIGCSNMVIRRRVRADSI